MICKGGKKWDIVPLSEVAEVVYGTRVVKKHDQGTKYPVYGGGGATFSVDRSNRSDCMIVSRFGMSAECVRFVGGEFFLNDSGLTVDSRDQSCLAQNFLDIQLLRLQPEIFAMGRGTAQKNLDVSAFKCLPIAIPPIEEQRRIVAVLDKAFEGLARARTNAETNLANARELFAVAMDCVLSEVASVAPSAKLQTLCGDRGITYGVIKLGEHIENGVPCLRTSNVRPLRIDTEGMKSISPELSMEYRRTILEGGEVLVNVRGTLGGVAVVPREMVGWNVSREVAMVPVEPSKLHPDFASFYIASKRAQDWLTGVVKGAAYKGINLTDLRLLEVPVPDMEEQVKTVRKLSALRDKANAVSAGYEAKLQDIDDLRQSLLQKAFAGELT